MGPTWRIDRATTTRQSGRCFDFLEVVEHLQPVCRELRTLLALLGRSGEQVGPQQRLAVEVEDVALVLDHAGPEQFVGGLRAEPLNVEGPPSGHVEDAVEKL